MSEIAECVNGVVAAGELGRVRAQPHGAQVILDQQGMRAVSEELRATAARIDRIQRQSNERLLGGRNPGEQRATLVMMFFADAEPVIAADSTKAAKKPQRRRRRPRRSQASA